MKEKSTHKIAALLTCYNRREKTLSCLASLFGAFLPENFKIEVFLVDDGSADGTGEAVKNRYPQVNVINGNGKLFWNKGMNLAWETASKTFNYDFYLWLNDDVILYKESIHRLINDFLKVNSLESILVGACQSVSKKITYSGFRGLTKKIMLEPNGEIQPCDYFNGNVVLISSQVFTQVGFLDPIFNHGASDFDYGLRAQKLGISSFVSSGFVGICERNSKFPLWCNPDYPFSVRLKSFKSPLGGRPKSTLIFEQRYLGLTSAVFHYFTIHLRLVFPKIWSNRLFK